MQIGTTKRTGIAEPLRVPVPRKREVPQEEPATVRREKLEPVKVGK
jgi:hypothetical protein